MARQTITGSQKVALASFAIGGGFAALFVYIWKDLPWGVAAILGFFCAAGVYPQLLQIVANEKIIDRGDWPNRKPREPSADKEKD